MYRSLLKVAVVAGIGMLVSLPALQVASAADAADDKVFYYLGTALSRNLVNLELSSSEAEAVAAGLRDALQGTAQKLDPQVYDAQLNQIAQQRMAVAATKEEAAAQAYLTKMAAEKGAVRTASGLIYLEQVAGDGAQPTATSAVQAHYRGTLRDGTVFDSSFERGEPLEIPLSQVIPCWTEAIAMMKEGGKSKLTCPPDIAYGPQGSGPIPPNAALTFEVELIAVVQ